MSAVVVAFPGLQLANHRTPRAIEVIVAPLAGLWVAWLRLPCGRFVALERTPHEWHALADARAYGSRHGVPVTVHSAPLGSDQGEPSDGDRGEISVWPDPADGGCWRVDHTSASGDSVGIVGSALSFDGAVEIAREAAQRLGAAFVEPGPSAA